MWPQHQAKRDVNQEGGDTVGDMDKDEQAQHLRRESARQRIAFIETDIDTAMTFLQLALTELNMRHLARVDELLGKARIAYAATARFLADVEDPVERRRLHDRHQALADAIWEVQGKRRHQQKTQDRSPPGLPSEAVRERSVMSN